MGRRSRRSRAVERHAAGVGAVVPEDLAGPARPECAASSSRQRAETALLKRAIPRPRATLRTLSTHPRDVVAQATQSGSRSSLCRLSHGIRGSVDTKPGTDADGRVLVALF